MSGQAAPAPATHNIPERQNEEHFLRLLRARSYTYAVATRFQIAQILLVVLLPVIGAVVGLIFPDTRPYVALASLVIAVLDAAWLDRSQRRKLRTAAKISEQFDCELLGLPWNKLAAGKPADPEQVIAAANRWRGGDAELRDWYPAEVGDAPLVLARVMYQRTNAWYDGSLRQRYGAWLLGIVSAAFIIFLITGLVLKLSLLDLTATVVIPAAPAVIWGLREHFRQRDIAESSGTTKAEADAMCEKAASAGCDESECHNGSRELQNAIYARRASSPLMLPFVYRLARTRMETQMRAGAAELLRRLRSKR